MKRSSSSMDNLFNERLLTKEDEIALAKRRDLGDQSARRALVEHNMKLVLSIARRFTTPQIELDDLIMEGVIGLDIAARKFDWERG